jgi:heat shock protein HslJ
MRARNSLPVLLSLACLSATAMAQSPQLAGTNWVLASAGKRAPMINFEADGKVTGFGGCNRFFGGYSQSGERLSFSAIGATRMACPGKAMEVEQDFFDMLNKVAAARLEGGKLRLLDVSGKQISALSKK